MRGKAKILTIVLAITATVACVSAPEVLDNDFKDSSCLPTTTINISLSESRTQLGKLNGNTYPLYWSAGDRISVNGLQSEEAEIYPNNPAIASFIVQGEIEGEYQIAYPYAPKGKVVFAENQMHKDNTTFGQGVSTMYGIGTSKGIQLNHLTGILKIGVVGSATLTKVRLSTTDRAVAGLFDIDFESGKVTPTSQAKYSVNYSFGGGVQLNTSEPTYMHIAIPAGEYSSINIVLYDSDGGAMSATLTAPNSKPIAAGVIREFDKNITYAANHKVEVGKPLPMWSEGYLDIHFINSARGECCFYIMPDGTTLLVDAGETKTSNTLGKESTEQRPSAQIRPYITYVNYIKHFLPHDKEYIDYCAPSHFHIDHIGQANYATDVSPEGFPLTGLLAIYYEIPFRHILDHTYPDYEIENDSDEEDSSNEDDSAGENVTRALNFDKGISYYWGNFVNWGVANNKFTATRFTPGEYQIEMLYAPKKYPYFKIFNLCANGFVWGAENGVEKLRGGEQDGNAGSCGFHIRYGNFDYIACGDLVSKAQNLVALYVRDFLNYGANQYYNFFDAFKAHHHLASNSWGTQMQVSTNHFTPKVVIDHCFNAHKPDPEKLSFIVNSEWSEGFFATNIHPNIYASHADLVNKITAYNGHIVLRVTPGGEEFYVYMLNDSDFEYRVKSIHGPYESH